MRMVTLIVLGFMSIIGNILVAPAIAILGAKIDFVLIFIALSAFFSGEIYSAVIAALYCGLAVDLTTQGIIQINTWLYIVLALLFVAAEKIIKSNSLPVVTASVLGAFLLKLFMLIFVLYACRFTARPELAVFIKGLPSAIVTMAATTGLYYVYRWLFSMEFMQVDPEQKRYIIE